MSAFSDDDPPPVPSPAEQLRPPRTALAFVLAPGIAALVGSAFCVAVGLATDSIQHLAEALAGVLMIGFYAALVGYATAVVFAVPLYLALPGRVRERPVAVVLLAGSAAAAPWLLLGLLATAAFLIGAPVAFALGCVAGVAFVLIRGTPPPPEGLGPRAEG